MFQTFENSRYQFGRPINATSFYVKHWLKQHCVQQSDSCTPLFCIKMARTCRHSDVLYGQPMVGTKLLFAHRVWNCWPDFVLICFIRVADIKKRDGSQ